MEDFTTSSFRLGIVGGGQLGRMLALTAANWDIRTYFLDKDDDAPAKIICDYFQKGSMTSYDDVVSFGEKVDVITIESDNVNAEALAHLESLGKKVFPKSSTLKIIQDKGDQRQFAKNRGLPVPKFEVFDTKTELLASVKKNAWNFPFIVKTRKAGYDGKGVFLVESDDDLNGLPDTGLLIEEKVKIKKELTAIAVRNGQGDVAVYPLVELFLSPSAYLVDYLISPMKLEPPLEKEAAEIARKLTEALEIEGLLAIEMFLDEEHRLLINECSPRPHNSGHQTIEGSFTSQYEQHLRGILNLPLGSTETKILSGMINLLGDAHATGPVKYKGLKECLKMPGVKLHLYGKKEVKPYRKMGHITILNHSREALEKMIHEVKEKIKVVS